MNRTDSTDVPTTLLADDPHDRQLAMHVHPGDWVNPEPAPSYNLVVVGGGTAGLVSAAGAAGLGARVALVEKHLLGGDCLNIGCVPSKALIAAARAWHGARRGHDFGAPRVEGDGDFDAAMKRMRRLRAGIAPHDSAARLRELGIDVFLGGGRFVDERTVEVNGSRLRFHRAVVATGARAAVPPICGLTEAGFLTNETVFSLEALPQRLLVIGAGPIGCELAQTFARFGAEVTIVDAGARILPREDADAAAVVAAALEREGVRCIVSAEILAAGRNAEGRWLRVRDAQGERELIGDHILVATGRRPNVEGIGLEAAGVDHDAGGGVVVDDRLRTTNPRIYAAGDVAGSWQFTHAADAMARTVLANALFHGRARASGLIIPRCTYTSPEIASVGWNAEEAAARGIEVDTVTVALGDVDRAVLDGETEGFARVHVRRGKDTIVGVTIVAADAGELIAEPVLAMTAGIGLGRIAGTVHPYPTRAEVVRKLADAWRRTKLTPTVRTILRWWFRLRR